MHILFTGASSFTGCWFVQELVRTGHTVTAICRAPLADYSGIRRQRLEQVAEVATLLSGISFGTPAFLKLIDSKGPWELLCHHAADVTNYKSPSFDVCQALANNTHNLPATLSALKEQGCQKILLTGSVFEPGEGKGSDQLRAVSPYGLSKGLTAETFRYYCAAAEMQLGKFVIPNPFGPWEEGRFTTFMAREWVAGRSVTVTCPDYVRDNIHASLLAQNYVAFAEQLPTQESYSHHNPSQYALPMEQFVARFATEMRPRLGKECNYTIAKQTTFPEPRIRINTQKSCQSSWDESAAWNALAKYYLNYAEEAMKQR